MTPNAPVTLPVKTRHGTFAAHYGEHGLVALDFPKRRESRAGKNAAPKTVRQWHTLTTRAVQSVLAGKTAVELPPLDLSGGTEFQRKVWEELSWTPCGETRSYAEIAKAIRKPKAVRAVGGACGANPIPLLIPCHRVLAANRKIGGFSGGLEWKHKLLAIEQVKLNA